MGPGRMQPSTERSEHLDPKEPSGLMFELGWLMQAGSHGSVCHFYPQEVEVVVVHQLMPGYSSFDFGESFSGKPCTDAHASD